MRDVHPHIVARYSLELDFQDQSDVRLVSEALMEASRGAISELIDACCNALIASEVYIMIPQLEVDLGMLDLRKLTHDFLEKFKSALAEQLQSALAAQGDLSPEARALDLVINYGETGQYPWWAGSPAPELLEAALATLLNSPDAQNHHRLRDLLREGQLLRRLTFALPSSQLAMLWRMMAGIAPPFLAQSTIKSATVAVLQMSTMVNRTQWLEFAYQSLQQIVHPSLGGSGRNEIIDWLLTEGEITIAPALLQRLRESDALVALLSWMHDVLKVPAAVLLPCLHDLGRQTVTSAMPQLRPDSQVFQTWLRAIWKVPASAVEQLMDGLVLIGFRNGPREQIPKADDGGSKVRVPAGLLAWLRETLAQPDAVLDVLLADIAARFVAENRAIDATAAALDSWLRSAFALPVEAREVLVQALVEVRADASRARPQEVALAGLLPWLQRTLERPEGLLEDLIVDLRERFAAENRSAEATPAALDSWLRTVFALPVEAREVLVAALWNAQASHQDPADRLHGRGLSIAQHDAQESEGMQTLLPWLRHSLGLPHATQAACLVAMCIRFEEENPAVVVSNAMVNSWLVDQYSLPPAARQLLSEGLLATMSAGQEKSPSDAAARHPELQFLIPWLRHTLGLASADLVALLGVLIGRFQARQGTSVGRIVEVDRWLRGNFALAAESRVLLAQAMVVEINNPESALAHSPHGLRDPIDQSDAGIDLQFSPHAIFSQAPTTQPSFAQDTPQHGDSQSPADDGDFGIAALLPWLRQTLGMPEATPSQLLAGLLASFRRDRGNAKVTLGELQTWLQRGLELGKGACNTLAHALQAAAQSEELTAQFAPQQELKPVIYHRPAQPSELPSFVENAGLILFWPFLQRFLQHQGLVDDKEFVSPVAQEQAVRLLQSMVMPGIAWNEAALTLPKLLCGLPPDALVDPFVPLTSAQEEADSVLIEVILAHWSMAGNMTADGFRQAWLQRNGTLRIRDDHWLLRVETLGHDILLEGLPWDIAYIQLPWMPHVMYVDWGEKAKFNA